MPSDEPQTLFLPHAHDYRYSDGIEFHLEKFHDGHEELKADVTVTYVQDSELLLSDGRTNLRAQGTVKSLGKSLDEAWPKGNGWPEITTDEWVKRVKHVCYTSTREYRNGGNPTVKLVDVEVDYDKPSFLLEPLVPDYGVVLDYGTAEAGKSLFVAAQMLSICTGHPILGITPTFTGPAIYFDWEDQAQTLRERTQAMCDAAGIAYPDNFHYREMDRPVAASEERILKEISDTGAIVAAFDSVGMMAGGDPSDPQLMINAMNVMKRVGIASIGIHHLNNEQAESTDLKKKERPYGSMYARASARLQWLLEGFEDTADPEVDRKVLYAINTKTNHGRRRDMSSWVAEFQSDEHGHMTSAKYSKRGFSNDYWDRLRAMKPTADLTTVEALKKILTDYKGAACTAAVLAEKVSSLTNRTVGEQTIRNRLNEGKKRGEYASSERENGTLWALASYRTEDF